MSENFYYKVENGKISKCQKSEGKMLSENVSDKLKIREIEVKNVSENVSDKLKIREIEVKMCPKTFQTN
jgi:hypothetical protein